MNVKKTAKAGAWMLAAAALLMGGKAQAATTADLTVTVTIQVVSLTASFRDAAASTFAMGAVAAASTNLIADPITITNSGNVAETYNLKITPETSGWTSVTAAPSAAEEYQMSGVFRAPADGAPVSGDYVDNSDDYSFGTTRTADGANILAKNGDSGGDGTKGYKMATGSNLYLWLRFKAPTSTSVTTQQSIVTRITAAYAP